MSLLVTNRTAKIALFRKALGVDVVQFLKESGWVVRQYYKVICATALYDQRDRNTVQQFYIFRVSDLFLLLSFTFELELTVKEHTNKPVAKVRYDKVNVTNYEVGDSDKIMKLIKSKVKGEWDSVTSKYDYSAWQLVAPLANDNFEYLINQFIKLNNIIII